VSTRKAEVGEAIPMHWRQSATSSGHTDYLVQPSCSGVPGFHYCVPHPDADARNNMSFNSHVDGPGKHVEVWICPLHGPEVP
jgi:hypothetical protein